MAAVWFRFRTEVRARWRGTLVLVLLLGLVGSVVLAAAAGARRTATAPDRLVAAVGGEGDAHILYVGAADPERIRALPQVERSVSRAYFFADTVPLTGPDMVVTDDPLYHSLVTEGRLPDPSDPTAAVIDQRVARALDLGAGDDLHLVLVTPDQLETLDPGTEPVPTATVRVAAVLREPDDLVGGAPQSAQVTAADGTVYVPESFLRRFGDRTAVANTVYSFDLAGGAGALDDFVADVRRLPGGDTVQFFQVSGTNRGLQRSVDAQALALALFAAVLALLGLVTVGQGVSRHLRLDAADGEGLRALGMTPGQRVGVAVLRGAVVGVGAAVLAVAGAVAWSGLTPIGLARQAEPDPGLDVNVAVLGAGAAGIVTVLIVRAAITGWATTRRGERGPRPGAGVALAARAAGAGAAPSFVTGLSFAHGGRRPGVSTRSTLAGVATGIVAVAAAVTFLASFDRLVGEPERFGWTFDAMAGQPYEDDPGDLFESLAREPGVEAFARAGGTAVEAEGRSIGLLGVEPGRGITPALVLDGRLPAGPREVALGRRTLDALDEDVGDTVMLDGSGQPLAFTVTGSAVVPETAQGGPGLGEGAVVTLEGLAALVPDWQPNVAFLRFAPGGESSPMMRQLRFTGDLQPPVLPDALYDVERVRTLPATLAGMLALVGAASLVHSLVGLVRTHRRDLAVLKTLGFTRRQVAATTAWQATVLVVVALAAGVPLGIAVGRWTWLAVAGELGVASPPVVPALALLVLAPAALIAGNLAAALPAWLAARLQPAEVLRAE